MSVVKQEPVKATTNQNNNQSVVISVPAELLSEVKPQFFSDRLIAELKSTWQNLETSADYLAWLGNLYTERVLKLCDLGVELDKLHKSLEPDNGCDSLQQEKSLSDFSQHKLVLNEIAKLTEEANNIEKDLLENFVKELRISESQYTLRSYGSEESLGHQFSLLSDRQSRELLLEASKPLADLLSSPDVINSCNFNSLYCDALPHLYSIINKADPTALKDKNFIRDLREYLGAKLTEMSLGIDPTYAQTPEEHKQAVARINFIHDFERSTRATLPYGTFMYGRSYRRPNDGYKAWAKVLTAKLVEDLNDKIILQINSKHALAYKAHALRVPEKQNLARPEYFSSCYNDELKGFHQVESVLDLLQLSGLISKRSSAEFRVALARRAIYEASDCSGLATDLKSLNREPEHVLSAAVDFLESSGKEHFVGVMGTNHTTLSFSHLYIDFLQRLKERNELASLSSSLSPEQFKLAEILSNPQSRLSELCHANNAAFFVYSPSLAFFVESIAMSLPEDSYKPVLRSWVSGGDLSQACLLEVFKNSDIANLLVHSGLNSDKIPTSFKLEPLLEAVALSPTHFKKFLELAGNLLADTLNELEALTVHRLGENSLGTYPLRKELLVNILNCLAHKDVKELIAQYLQDSVAPVVQTNPSNINSSAVGKLVVEGWQAGKQALLIGEEHTNKEHSKLPIEAFRDLVSAGMTDLCLELFRDLNPIVESFFKGQIGLEELNQELSSRFDPEVLKAEPTKVASVVALIDLCRRHNINIHCVDHHSSVHSFFNRFTRAVSADDLESGLASEQATRFFYKDRNCEMARNINLIQKLNSEAGVVLIAGALHISDRIESYTVGTALRALGGEDLSLELIGGDHYQQSKDKRINPEIFKTQQADKSNLLFSGVDSTALRFIHLPIPDLN